MSVAKDRHLTAVADIAGIPGSFQSVRDGLAEVTRLVVRQAAGTPLDEQPPAVVLQELAALDADHETACDVLDLAAADVETARRDLTDAARRLADAEERWARAGIVADETSRAVIAAREAAGLTLTATGYRRRP